MFGTFISMNNAGHNILGSANGSGTGDFSATFGDQIGVTPTQLNLGTLQNNGGTTLTDALQSPSVAIDTGNNSLATGAGLTTDQRGTGYTRIFNNTVDVGAFEAQTTSPPGSPPPGSPPPGSPPPGSPPPGSPPPGSPPPGSPPPGSPPPGSPPGGSPNSTNIAITSVVNQYVGFTQIETVTVDVTDPAGVPINFGGVTLQVNGETVFAPVPYGSNGVFTVTIDTPIINFAILPELFFAHTLTAG